uniref:Coronin n=1 Tax=Buteo japonicus TaxID=224669 RepID=A0A8C0BUP1_9AVES
RRAPATASGPSKTELSPDVGFPSPSQAWIGGIRAGSITSCGNHVKASCPLIPPSCDVGSPGVLRDQSLEKQQAQVKRCWHPARSGSPALGLTYLFLGLQVKVWRLPESGQDMPSNAGLTLGPGGGPVDMLQFHPTADGVLASGAGKRVTIWDVAQQQPLTGRHGRTAASSAPPAR